MSRYDLERQYAGPVNRYNLRSARLPAPGFVALGASGAEMVRRAYRSYSAPPASTAAAGTKKVSGKGKVSNRQQLRVNSAGTPVVTSGGKRKVTKRKKRQTIQGKKQIMASVKRLIRKTPKVLMHSQETNDFQQLASAVNKVEWTDLVAQTVTDFRARLTYRTIGNTSGVSAIETIDADIGGYAGKKFYFKDSYDLNFKNNTNSAAQLIVYLVKCTDYTSFDPLTELTEMRKAGFSDSSVLVKEDDFNQYFSIPRIARNKRKWVMQKKWQLDLGGGEEARVFVNIPQSIFDPSFVFEEGNQDYYKGQFAIVTRIMGKPSHDSTNTALLGLSNTLVDIRIMKKLKTFQQSSLVVQPIRQMANTNVALVTAVVADPEVPGVGTFDAT